MMIEIGDWVKYRHCLIIHFAEVKEIMPGDISFVVTGKRHPVPIKDILEVRKPNKAQP